MKIIGIIFFTLLNGAYASAAPVSGWTCLRPLNDSEGNGEPLGKLKILTTQRSSKFVIKGFYSDAQGLSLECLGNKNCEGSTVTRNESQTGLIRLNSELADLTIVVWSLNSKKGMGTVNIRNSNFLSSILETTNKVSPFFQSSVSGLTLYNLDCLLN